MWVVPPSSELAGSKKSHPFFKPFTCLLLRKKRKDWEKKTHETKCFFAIKSVQIIWEVLTPPKVFRVRANSKSKSLTRQLSLNFHKTRFERFLYNTNVDLRIQDVSYFYKSHFLSFGSFDMESLLSSNFCNFFLSFSPYMENQMMKNWWD